MLIYSLAILLATGSVAKENIVDHSLPGAEQSLKADHINLEARKDREAYEQQKTMAAEMSEATQELVSEEAPLPAPRTLLKAQQYNHPSINLPN